MPAIKPLSQTLAAGAGVDFPSTAAGFDLAGAGAPDAGPAGGLAACVPASAALPGFAAEATAASYASTS